ncbi:SGNH/GDSL hydrolase family protein [Streptomonospora nanhaiensis]|uniref:SGNH/GDSL hydrolase family protein n=1 Tax=Streptomonospora nanhaiensis TaxID=1323731 RepID=UPI001C37FE5C|nr:SGNH/GDSL hydrolase family protein [Streptomonospora nanhaiensis]MBV2365520.1 SGNH/GDSL hydrolase family protein [Streptomonospora nanhaiensis]MBX9391300.1 SGNH/GDSL hydrolase family protein [Streptomonospora nanhaiensis]
MRTALLTAAQALVWAAAPVLLVQGRRVRRTALTLPPARGTRGTAPGTGAAEGAAGPEPLRLLVLGDSSAAGVGVDSLADGVPGRVAAELAAATGRAVEWRAAARSGADSARVAGALLPAAAREAGAAWRPDLVLVVVGVNDITRMTSGRAFARNAAAIAGGVRARWPRAATAFSALPPLERFPALPWPLRPLLGLRSRYLDARLRAVLARLPGADHAAFPRSALSGPELFSADGFHPGAEGYRRWAGHLAARLRNSLDTSGRATDSVTRPL